MTFQNFFFSDAITEALTKMNYSIPTPIQTQAIPLVQSGADLFGIAQTGTGKTAAFALPIIDAFLKKPKVLTKGTRCLVLTPTRELALQVAESFSNYSKTAKLKVAVVFGGVGIEPQKSALRRKPEILVATPGRLLDLMSQNECNLMDVDTFVLDEADRMFDMGFIKDVNRIVDALPSKRQTLMFSATLSKEVEVLARKILVNPKKVEVTPVSKTADTIEQYVYFVDTKERLPLLRNILLEKQNESEQYRKTIVFVQMKHMANKIADKLRLDGILADAFHSNKSQNARQRILSDFKAGKTDVLIATDIAARGLDVADVEWVVNFDLPDVAETYVHRIGRAGRAGKQGFACSLVDFEQLPLLSQIEKTTKAIPEIVSTHDFTSPLTQKMFDTHTQSRENGHSRISMPRRMPSKPSGNRNSATASSGARSFGARSFGARGSATKSAGLSNSGTRGAGPRDSGARNSASRNSRNSSR